jgi:putative heme iron utilization protein
VRYGSKEKISGVAYKSVTNVCLYNHGTSLQMNAIKSSWAISRVNAELKTSISETQCDPDDGD